MNDESSRIHGWFLVEDRGGWQRRGLTWLERRFSASSFTAHVCEARLAGVVFFEISLPLGDDGELMVVAYLPPDRIQGLFPLSEETGRYRAGCEAEQAERERDWPENEILHGPPVGNGSDADRGER